MWIDSAKALGQEHGSVRGTVKRPVGLRGVKGQVEWRTSKLRGEGGPCGHWGCQGAGGPTWCPAGAGAQAHEDVERMSLAG